MVLLDTHALVWALVDPGKLSKKATETISNVNSQIFVSAASAWEISTKVRIGKMPEAVVLEMQLEQSLLVAGFQEIPISIKDALLAGRLEGKHRDPFDRMIAAHALALDILVVSIDPKLDEFGVRRIW
jgi:PIN domain nuclease of toxin-antitoxin system